MIPSIVPVIAARAIASGAPIEGDDVLHDRRRHHFDRRAPQASSPFLRNLIADIRQAWIPEAELTLRVAVMSAGGMSRSEIVRVTGAEDIEVRMALRRLSNVAEAWRAA